MTLMTCLFRDAAMSKQMHSRDPNKCPKINGRLINKRNMMKYEPEDASKTAMTPSGIRFLFARNWGRTGNGEYD